MAEFPKCPKHPRYFSRPFCPDCINEEEALRLVPGSVHYAPEGLTAVELKSWLEASAKHQVEVEEALQNFRQASDAYEAALEAPKALKRPVPEGAICVCGALTEGGHAGWCKSNPVYKAALAQQVAGDHYKKLKIQPIEYIHANGIPFAEGSVIKYVTRWRDKGGLKDLEKARHFLDLLIELEKKGGAT